MANSVEPIDITNAKKAYRTKKPGEHPSLIDAELILETAAKYGENPNQSGAVYQLGAINELQTRKLADITNFRYVRTDDKGKGGLSLTNYMDIAWGMNVLTFFRSSLAVAIMKHNIISGFVKGKPNQKLSELYRTARDVDRRSNFGGTLVVPVSLNRETAEAMYELKEQGFFIDVVAAPEYDEGVVGYIEGQSKNIRIAAFSGLDKLPRFPGDETYGLLSFKEMPTGRMGVQDLYLTSIRSADDLILRPMVVEKKSGQKHAVNRVPTERELEDLLTAWYLNVVGGRSNKVVAVRDGMLVSMGSGQVERVGAVEQMIIKGMQKAMDREGIKYDALMGIQGSGRLKDNPFTGAVVSSDAFFPFPDSVHELASVGVSAVIQPYGSERDHFVIDAVNQYGMAAPATLERCFVHR